MMSRVPMGADGGAWALEPQLAFKTYFVMQGISADLLASLHGHSRQDLDAFAAQSHQRAAQAWEAGYFDKSVVPVQDFLGLELLARDETIRPGTSVQSLAGRPAAFAPMGTQYGYDSVALQRYPQLERIEHAHHAGNSSGIVDGAAAVLLGNAQAGTQHGLKARARIVSFATIGSEPTLMLDAPSHAAQKALARAGMQASDIDLWEINEAFSSVVLTFMKALHIDPDRINVNGGAIAMGHPLGASGAMILGTVLDELERRGLRTALVCLCVAAGMGSAMVIERV
jgi:acetyl-CoA C-acetyltransferase